MKTLKVKFILFSLTALFAISLTSCEQEIIETPIDEVNRVAQFESDPNYRTLTSLNDQLLNEVRNAMILKGVSGEDLKNMYISGQTNLLEAFFEGTQIESIMSEITPIANQLSTEYNDLMPTNQDFEANISEGFNKLTSTSIESRCTWQYSVCVAGASAGLALCIGSATAATGGVVIPLCYIAYTATVVLCADSYCDI